MGIIKIDNVKIGLKKIISDSDLGEGKKYLWSNFIHAIAEEDALAILETLQDDIRALDFLTENLEEKIKAINSGDKNSWQEIIRKEKEFIGKN